MGGNTIRIMVDLVVDIVKVHEVELMMPKKVIIEGVVIYEGLAFFCFCFFFFFGVCFFLVTCWFSILLVCMSAFVFWVLLYLTIFRERECEYVFYFAAVFCVCCICAWCSNKEHFVFCFVDSDFLFVSLLCNVVAATTIASNDFKDTKVVQLLLVLLLISLSAVLMSISTTHD